MSLTVAIPTITPTFVNTIAKLPWRLGRTERGCFEGVGRIENC